MSEENIATLLHQSLAGIETFPLLKKQIVVKKEFLYYHVTPYESPNKHPNSFNYLLYPDNTNQQIRFEWW